MGPESMTTPRLRLAVFAANPRLRLAVFAANPRLPLAAFAANKESGALVLFCFCANSRRPSASEKWIPGSTLARRPGMTREWRSAGDGDRDINLA
jgi:hypothetical protein